MSKASARKTIKSFKSGIVLCTLGTARRLPLLPSIPPLFLPVSDWIIHNDKSVSPVSDQVLHSMMVMTKCAPARSWRYDSCWVLFLRVLLQRGIYFNQANLHCDIVWNRLDSFPQLNIENNFLVLVCWLPCFLVCYWGSTGPVTTQY